MAHATPGLAYGSIAYALFCLCFAFPPIAFRGAGLTVDNIFAHRLGDQGMFFVDYTMRRTAYTLASHGALALAYAVYVLANEYAWLAQPWTEGVTMATLHVAALGCLCAALLVGGSTAILVAWSWSWGEWERHPFAKVLATYHSDWRMVGRSINAEFRHIDKVVRSLGVSTVVVTDTWIIVVRMYTLDIALQSDVDLTIESSVDIGRVDSAEPRQLLTLRVTSIHPGCRPFTILLDSADYTDLRSKLTARVRNSREVLIRMSLSDQFVARFKELVEAHPRQPALRDLSDELCLVCMLQRPNVVIRAFEAGGTRCQCPPRCCLDCLGHWFANSQDQNRPGTWMSGTAECPACRAEFNIREVSMVTT